MNSDKPIDEQHDQHHGDGPLTRLIDDAAGSPKANPEPALPQQTDIRREGREDYASGTPNTTTTARSEVR